ncbi:MAG: hypothetical protein QXM75_02870 [Candidatus Diapherotrites archaeon]
MDILAKSFEEYKKNFNVCLLFALLLVFVPFFIIPIFANPFFETGITISSGTIFLDYIVSAQTVAIVLFAIVFIAAYSFLISLVCLAVRRDLSKVKVHFYLKEMVQRFSFRIFIFNLVLFSLIFLTALMLASLSVYLLLIFLVFVFVLLFFLMFVPQVIVVDEVPLDVALSESIQFVKKNPFVALQVVIASASLLLVVSLIEYAIDLLALNGLFGEFFAREFIVGETVSIAITMIFVVPYIEILKTFFYMLKFDLIKKQLLAR